MWFHAQFANKSWTDSNTRFYPELKKDQLRNGNVLPGTCVDTDITHPTVSSYYLAHTMLRLDATQKKRCLAFDFKFKTFSIKQATFFSEIYSFRIKVRKQKKIWSFFLLILLFISVFF